MNGKTKFHWFYLVGFFLILALPLLNLPPWFSPPDWGKTIVFRIILSILIFVFLYEILSKKQFSIKTSLAFWLLIALFGVYLLATVFSLDRNFSLWGSPYRSGGFANFAFYIIFAILAFLILRDKDWQKIWDFALIIGFLVSIIAVFQQFDLISKIFIPFERQPPSTIGGPIFLGIYLLLLSFVALSFGIETKNLFKKIFYFLSFLLFIFVAIIIAQTRAAFLGFGIGFLWFIFFYPKKLLLLKIVALILLILGIFGLYFLKTHPEVYTSQVSIVKNALGRILILFTGIKAGESRISAWKISLQALRDRPILGYGPENFAIGFDKYYNSSLPRLIEAVPWWDRAHNFIFDISISAGVPALIIYLLLFGVLFFQLQKLKNAEKNADEYVEKTPKIIYHGIQATFLAYLSANFFSFDTFSSYLISFLLIAYSLHLINLGTNLEPESQNKKIQRPVLWKLKKYKGVIMFLLFISLIWFIWTFNIKPFQINTRINAAKYLVENGGCKEAISFMEEVLPKQSFLDAYLRQKYVEFMKKCGVETPEKNLEFIKKGYQLLKENIKIQPYYTRNWLLLGGLTNILITQEKNPEIKENLKNEANSYFEKAYELSPKRQEVFLEWIKTDLLTGEYQKAKEKAQKCIDLNPKLGECWWLMGLINISLTEDKKAQENINIAGEKGYPIYSKDSFLQLAKVYAETKNYQKLIGTYQELIKIRPSEPRYHSSLATVYKELGQFEKARQEALIVLELAPELREEVETFLRELP